MIKILPTQVRGLPAAEAATLAELEQNYLLHQTANAQKSKYYEGHVSLRDVNLGIAIPKDLQSFVVGCSWGAKSVDVLAARSMFDGYVSSQGTDAEDIDEIVEANDLVHEYAKATRDELKYGCVFATLSADDKIGCRIRYHSPLEATALWDGQKGRIGAGLAILDTVPDTAEEATWQPSVVALYTDTDVWLMTRSGNIWTAQRMPHRMGRPLMEPMIWDATSDKPFGRSRLKRPIRELIDGYVRTVANATIGLEFATSPQKYLLGVTDEQYDTLINDKFKQYVGSLLAATTNPETGEPPQFGQLAQGNIEPHVQMLRILATQFSAATGLTVMDTGVVNDANPTSSDAILAQSQTLVAMAQQLNTGNAGALCTIAQMALAIKGNVTLDELPDTDKAVVAHFKNPAMPSVSVTADAAFKIASSRTEFASTDVFLEMIGFDQADIRRIKAQEQRVRGQQILSEEFAHVSDDQSGNVEGIRDGAVADQRDSGAEDGVVDTSAQ